MKNGNTVEQELRRHAAILADCITHELDHVYNSYTPKVYQRTYDLYNSIYIGGDIKLDISTKRSTMSINVCFDEGAIHTRFDGEEANTAVLLNEGWQTHGRFANVPYLGYREATRFIEKGIEEYKSSVRKPLKLILKINDETRIF